MQASCVAEQAAVVPVDKDRLPSTGGTAKGNQRALQELNILQRSCNALVILEPKMDGSHHVETVQDPAVVICTCGMLTLLT